jgi:hypothetical protein
MQALQADWLLTTNNDVWHAKNSQVISRRLSPLLAKKHK